MPLAGIGNFVRNAQFDTPGIVAYRKKKKFVLTALMGQVYHHPRT